MPDPQPLSRARDRTHILLDTVRVHYCWATTGTPFWIILNSQWNGLLFPHILLQWSFFVWFFVWKQNQIMWFLNSNPPDGLSSHSEWNPKSFHCSMWPNMVLPQVSFRCYLQLPSPSIIFFFQLKRSPFNICLTAKKSCMSDFALTLPSAWNAHPSDILLAHSLCFLQFSDKMSPC